MVLSNERAQMPQKEGSPARRDLVKDDFTFVRWLDTGLFVNDGSAQKQSPQTPAKQADYVSNAAKPAPSLPAVTPLARNNKKMKAVVIASPDDKAKKTEDKNDVAESIGTPSTNYVPTIKNPPMGIFLDSDKDTAIRSVIPKPPPMGIFLDSEKDKDAIARGLSRKPTMGTFMDSDKEVRVRGVVISPPLEGLSMIATAAAVAAEQQRRSSISPGMDSNSLTQRKRPLKKQSIPLEDDSPRIKKARVESTSPTAQSQFAALSPQLVTAVPATQNTQQTPSPRISVARPVPTEHYVSTASGSESSYYTNSREGLSSGSTTDLALQGQHHSSQHRKTSSYENYSAYSSQPSGHDALHASTAYQYRDMHYHSPADSTPSTSTPHRRDSVMTTQPTVPSVQLPSIQGILNDAPLPAHRAGSISTTSGPDGSTWVNSTTGQKYPVTNSSSQSPQPYDVSYQRHTDSPNASSHHPSVKRQSSMAVSTLVNPGYDHVTPVSRPVNDASYHMSSTGTTSPAPAPQLLPSTNHSLYQTQYNQSNQRQHPSLPHRSQGLSPSPNTPSSVKTGPIGDYHRGAVPSADQPGGALAGAGSEMLVDNRRSAHHGASSSATHARHRRVSSSPAGYSVSGNIPLNTPTAPVSRGTSPANRRPYHLPYTQSAQQQSVEHERTRMATSSQHHHITHASHAQQHQHHHQAYQSNSRRPPVDPVLVAQHLHHQHLEEQLQHHNPYGRHERRTPSTSSVSSPSAPGSRTSSFDANPGSRTSSLDVQRNSSFEANHSRTPSFDTHRNSSFDANHSRTPSFDANPNSRASSFDAHRTSSFDASQSSRTPSYDINRASFDTNSGSKHSSFDTNRNSSVDTVPGSRNLSCDPGKPSDNSAGDIKSVHPHHQQSIHSNSAAMYESSRLLTSSPPPLVKDESQRHNSQSQGQPLGQPQMPPPHSVYWSQQQPSGPQH